MDWEKNTMKIDENDNIKMEGTVKDVLSSIQNIFLEYGLKNTIKKIIKRIYYKLIGVDFSMQTLDDLTIIGTNKLSGTICGSSSEEVVKDVLTQLVAFDKNILEGSFIDYGSGKGRLIITARNFGFQKAIGIEFAKELVDITTKNIKKLDISNIHVIHMDASHYIPEPETRVIYFLNPFREDVFHKVLPQIIRYKENFKNDVYIVYRAPIYKTIFSDYPQIKHIKHHVYKSSITEFYRL